LTVYAMLADTCRQIS